MLSAQTAGSREIARMRLAWMRFCVTATSRAAASLPRWPLAVGRVTCASAASSLACFRACAPPAARRCGNNGCAGTFGAPAGTRLARPLAQGQSKFIPRVKRLTAKRATAKPTMATPPAESTKSIHQGHIGCSLRELDLSHDRQNASHTPEFQMTAQILFESLIDAKF